jgi:hypothetical protein
MIADERLTTAEGVYRRCGEVERVLDIDTGVTDDDAAALLGVPG